MKLKQIISLAIEQGGSIDSEVIVVPSHFKIVGKPRRRVSFTKECLYRPKYSLHTWHTKQQLEDDEGLYNEDIKKLEGNPATHIPAGTIIISC